MGYTDIEKMFSVREMPWHAEKTLATGQAEVMADFPRTWAEARVRAGLDWDPEEAAAYGLDLTDEQIAARFASIVYDGSIAPEQLPGLLTAAMRDALIELPEFKRVVRSDTRATLALPRDSYPLIRNSDFGDIFEAILAVDKDALKPVTGGCLDGGRHVWMLIQLDEPILLPADKTVTMPFLGLTSRHDATGAAVLRATAVRIVCGNTFKMAELEGDVTGLTYRFTHVGDWRARIDDARDAITGARAEMRAYRDMAEHLLGVPVTAPQRELFIAEFIPAPPAGLASARVLGNVERARQQIRDLIAGPTITGAEIENTAYGLVQAAGEYLDHVRRSQSWETRLRRTLLSPEPAKRKAMTLALDAAKA